MKISDLKAEMFLLQGRIKMKKYEGRFAYPSDPTIPIPTRKTGISPLLTSPEGMQSTIPIRAPS